jgi:hypothetical protein
MCSFLFGYSEILYFFCQKHFLNPLNKIVVLFPLELCCSSYKIPNILCHIYGFLIHVTAQVLTQIFVGFVTHTCMYGWLFI